MILEDIRGYLLTNSIAPVYISFEPPASGITLYLYPGKQADPWNPRYRYYSMQVVSRFSSFETSQQIANQAYTVLQNLSRQVGATDIINCYANQEPYQLGYDEANQAKFVQNFSIECIVDNSVDPSGYVTVAGYSIDWANIINTPTTVSGYGITDVLSSNRNLTINGVTQNLSTDRTWIVGDLFSYSGYANPSWITSLDYGKLINVPPSSGTGTVTSVGLSAPDIFSVTGSPITSSGTFDLDLVTQNANLIFSGPFSGSAAIPTFRTLAAADLPAHQQAWSSILNTPTSLSGYGITDAVPSGRTLTINGVAQTLAADRAWNVGDLFSVSGYANPPWIISLDYSKLINVPPTSGAGTVTYVGLTVPDIFSVAGSPIVSSGTLALSLATQVANTIFSGPTTGINAIPTFRSLVSADLPVHNQAWSTITDRPITLSGYGIVDAVWISGAYVNPDWLVSLAWNKITSTPTTLAGYGITDPIVLNTRIITINGLGQDLSVDRTWNVGNVFTTSSYNDPSWLVTLDWSKITNEPTTLAGYGITDAYTEIESDNRFAPISISGTLRYVSLALPDIFTINNVPLTGPGGTISGVFNSQTQNRFFASPYGGDGVPIFRAIGSNDIPSGVFYDRTITINGLSQDLSANRTWNVGNVFTTSAYNNPDWLVTLDWSKITNEPTTLIGFGITDAVPSGRRITINGNTQTLEQDRTWSVGNVFTTSSYNDPSWLVSLDWSKITNTPALGTGTVTYAGLIASGIFTISGSPITTSGTFGIELKNQGANTFFAGPSIGSVDIPRFRTLVLADLPQISFANIASTPTTLAGYGITDAYTQAQSNSRFVPSGLYPPVSMYWTSSGNIMYVAHSGGIMLGFPYVAGSGFLTYAVADATNQSVFIPVTSWPVILDYNDVFMASCSGLVIYKSATFPRIA